MKRGTNYIPRKQDTQERVTPPNKRGTSLRFLYVLNIINLYLVYLVHSTTMGAYS